MRDTNKLRSIVAKRHGLTTEETSELAGRTLAQLTSHARHLLGRRDAVDAAAKRHPGTPDYVIEGAYDGGGVHVDDHAGRTLAHEALVDAVHGKDRKTTNFLAGIGRHTAANPDVAKHARITERLRAAGFTSEET